MAITQTEDMTDIYLENLTYYKTEVDDMLNDLDNKIQADLDMKADKIDVGSPGGIATLDSLGKHTQIEIPYANATEGLDPNNVERVMNPKRVDEAINAFSLPRLQELSDSIAAIEARLDAAGI